MRTRLQQFRTRFSSAPQEIRQEASDVDRERLRALGYLEEP